MSGEGPDSQGQAPSLLAPLEAVPLTDARPRVGRDRPRFVERQTYRRRRMVDAACMLPLLGVLLWMLPLLWSAGDVPVSMSRGLIYLFAVWVGLAAAAALIIRAIRLHSNPDRPEPEAAR